MRSPESVSLRQQGDGANPPRRICLARARLFLDNFSLATGSTVQQCYGVALERSRWLIKTIFRELTITRKFRLISPGATQFDKRCTGWTIF